jgi:hypothetical protein
VASTHLSEPTLPEHTVRAKRLVLHGSPLKFLPLEVSVKVHGLLELLKELLGQVLIDLRHLSFCDYPCDSLQVSTPLSDVAGLMRYFVTMACADLTLTSSCSTSYPSTVSRNLL